MRFRIERGPNVDRDLESIFDFLFVSWVEFGERDDDALERAAEKIERIEQAIEGLGALPHQGTLRPDLMRLMRCVTKDRAILYFAVDEAQQTVRVLAVFFGGRDHQREMLKRAMRQE